MEGKRKAIKPTPRSRKKTKQVGTEDTPKTMSRYDSSLGLLTKRFITLMSSAEGGVLDLNQAAEALSVQKRRIYDITNVLEGIGLIEKESKNNIQWKGSGILSTEDAKEIEELSKDVEKFKKEETNLDEELKTLQNTIKQLTEAPENSKHCYVTYDDIRELPNIRGETILAIKAPSGTRLDVPDPDEGMEPGKRRYHIYLRNDNGQPINVFWVNRVEESDGNLVNLANPKMEPEADDLDYLNIKSEGVSDLYGDDFSDNNHLSV